MQCQIQMISWPAEAIEYTYSTASIWFEIWGVVDPGKKSPIFPSKFPQNFDFSMEKFRYFQANLGKISIFSGKLTKNFDFLFFSGKNFRITFFSHLLQNVHLSRQNLPFRPTAKF